MSSLWSSSQQLSVNDLVPLINHLCGWNVYTVYKTQYVGRSEGVLRVYDVCLGSLAGSVLQPTGQALQKGLYVSTITPTSTSYRECLINRACESRLLLCIQLHADIEFPGIPRLLPLPSYNIIRNMVEFQSHRLHAHPWQCEACGQRNTSVSFPRCELCGNSAGPDGENLEKAIEKAVGEALRGMRCAGVD